MNTAEIHARAEEIAHKWQSRMALPGALGLPPLLEARRLKYAIPDAAFMQQALFEKILLWQIPLWDGDTFGDTRIVMSERSRTRVGEEAPRGVIVSAGLGAQNFLTSNGSGIGHIVSFVRLLPWRLPIAIIEGHEIYLIPLFAGDIIADLDLADAIRDGQAAYVERAPGDHVLKISGVEATGHAASPQTPKDF